jgi:DNA polymerase
MDAPEQQLRAYVDYLRDMGVYDLYRRENPSVLLPESLRHALATSAATIPVVKAATVPPAPVVTAADRPSQGATATPGHGPPPQAAPPALPPDLTAPMPKPLSFDALAPLPARIVPAAERVAALAAVRANIGDCTRCPLAYAGRRNIVFADGDPNARLMFVGEGPGADEDATGVPFVGKAGQLLNNMIAAMGLQREEVYIANIVKCRPPANRTPEFVEATTCSQFLLEQINIVRPQVIVALGATAATYLLGVRQSLASLRGVWHSARGAKVAVTYHPAYLLRDPRQKGEAWKDLQRVMAELGLKPPPKPTSAG